MAKYIAPVALMVALSVVLLALPFWETVQAGPGMSVPIAARYKAADVINGGSVKGTVKLTKAVTLPELVIGADVETCAAAKTSPRLVFDKASLGVGNVVVFLDGIESGKKAVPTQVMIDQKGCQYFPHITVVPAKSKVNFKSSDGILHNVHVWKGTIDNPHSKSGDVLNAAMKDNTVSPSPMSKRAMRKPGFYFVQCDAGHYWMSAYIFVVEHPYYVVTNDKGEFELKDVPAGTYNLRFWHEGWEAKPDKQGDKVVGYSYGAPIQNRASITVEGGKVTKADWTIPN